MFDISGGEFLLIGLVALIVIGPKELPGLLRTIGQSMNKLRRMAGEFRQQFDEAMREADMADAQKAVKDTADLASSAMTAFNPLATIRNEIKSTVDEIKGAGKEAEAAAASATSSVMDARPASLDIVEPPSIAARPPVETLSAPQPPVEVLEAPPADPIPAAKPKRARKKISDDA